MPKKISRREFVQKTIEIGLAVTAGHTLFPPLLRSSNPASAKEAVNLAVVSGNEYARSTAKAVEILGGIEKFVPRKARVALLPNVQRSNPGTFTNPEIVRAVIRLSKQAGASEVNLLSWLAMKNWESTGLAKVAAEEGANLKLFERDEANFKPVPIPAGKTLKEARILSEFYNHDVFINMPITKDHAGNRFTGTMKNLMGLNSPANNRTFHKENWETDAGAIDHLDQCIADLNTVLKPTLCIVDATEFIVTNGPMGPGELLKPHKVIAGVDRVAVDSFCASLWGLKGEEILHIRHGFEHKLGEVNLQNVKMREITL